MSWLVVAVIVVIVTLLVEVLIIVLTPILRSYKWRKALPQLTKLRDRAVNLQNENWYNDLRYNDLKEFEREVEILRGLVLTEKAKVSKNLVGRYNGLNKIDTTPFEDIIDQHQRMLLGHIRQTWQIANEAIDKYS